MRCQRNDVFISHGNRHVDFPSHQPEQEETAKTSAHLAKLADSADNVADLCIEIHAQLLVESMILGLQGIQNDYGNEFIILNFKEV